MDPITDMLNRIRNAQAVSHATVNIPFSKIKYEVAKILEKKGLITSAEVKGRRQRKTIKIALRYDEQKEPAITGLKRISKPGQRIYRGFKDIKKVRQGQGMLIVSTPQGLVTGDEARKKKLGGEVLCEVW